MGLKDADLHTKRTGHADFDDKTSEAAKPIKLEAPKTAMESEEIAVAAAESNQPEGDFSIFSCSELIALIGFYVMWEVHYSRFL